MLSKQFAVSLERSMYKKKSLTKIAILTAVVAIGISITYAQDDEEDPIESSLVDSILKAIKRS